MEPWEMMVTISGDEYDFYVVDSVGLNGGFVLLWKPEVMKLHVLSGAYFNPNIVCQIIVEVCDFSYELFIKLFIYI